MNVAHPTNTTASGTRPVTRSMLTKPVSSSSTGEKVKVDKSKAGPTTVRPPLRKSPRKATQLSSLLSSPLATSRRKPTRSSSQSPKKKRSTNDDEEID